MGKLTFAKIKALRTPGRYGDGGTLFLNVAPAGSKSWVQRLTIYGVRRDIGLGGWPLLSLAAARVKAFENRKLARIDDGDPLAGRRRAKMRTFEQVAREAHEANRARWSRKHAFNWLSSLERFAFPVLGRMPVDKITGQDVLAVLGPIPADTARRVRQRIRTALGFALGHGYVASNAAGADLDGALPAAAAQAKHFRALPYRGRGGGPGNGRGFRGFVGGERLFPFPGPDGRPERRGQGRDLGRNQPRGAGVAHTGRAHEIRGRASRPAVRCGGRGPGAHEAPAGPERAGIPVSAGGRSSVVGNDPDKASEGLRPGGCYRSRSAGRLPNLGKRAGLARIGP